MTNAICNISSIGIVKYLENYTLNVILYEGSNIAKISLNKNCHELDIQIGPAFITTVIVAVHKHLYIIHKNSKHI